MSNTTLKTYTAEIDRYCPVEELQPADFAANGEYYDARDIERAAVDASSAASNGTYIVLVNLQTKEGKLEIIKAANHLAEIHGSKGKPRASAAPIKALRVIVGRASRKLNKKKPLTLSWDSKEKTFRLASPVSRKQTDEQKRQRIAAAIERLVKETSLEMVAEVVAAELDKLAENKAAPKAAKASKRTTNKKARVTRKAA